MSPSAGTSRTSWTPVSSIARWIMYGAGRPAATSLPGSAGYGSAMPEKPLNPERPTRAAGRAGHSFKAGSDRLFSSWRKRYYWPPRAAESPRPFRAPIVSLPSSYRRFAQGMTTERAGGVCREVIDEAVQGPVAGVSARFGTQGCGEITGKGLPFNEEVPVRPGLE